MYICLSTQTRLICSLYHQRWLIIITRFANNSDAKLDQNPTVWWIQQIKPPLDWGLINLFYLFWNSVHCVILFRCQGKLFAMRRQNNYICLFSPSGPHLPTWFSFLSHTSSPGIFKIAKSLQQRDLPAKGRSAHSAHEHCLSDGMFCSPEHTWTF